MDARKMFGVARMVVGGSTWIAPRASELTFGLGNIGEDPRAALVGRLFGSRDLLLGAAVFAGIGLALLVRGEPSRPPIGAA